LYLGWFLATALAAGWLVRMVWMSPTLVDHVVLEAIAPSPPSSEYFLSVTDLNAIDGFVYLHELEDVCAPLRSSDVVFFGDSTLQFAFRGEVLRTFFAERDLNYYLLGFPNGSIWMARAVLERCKARPRLAVVLETGFFVGQPEGLDEEVLASSEFDARKSRMEFEMAFAVRRRLHRLLPHPIGRDWTGGDWILYRNPDDGGWWVAAGSERDIPVTGGPVEGVSIPSEHLQVAEHFRSMIDDGGGNLLLAYVPTKRVGRGRAHAIAEYLGVPIIDPDPPGLRTADAVHLREESSDRFAGAFTELLERYLPPTE
jgi:hypothetical protein